MKYRNKETGFVLEPRSEVVAAQYAANELFEEYPAEEAGGERPLEKMRKAELLFLAASLGVQLPEKATNAELAELIREAREQP